MAFFLCTCFIMPITAQNSKSSWSPVNISQLQNDAKWSRKTEPTVASYYQLDLTTLKNKLSNAPQRGASNLPSGVLIDYPTSNGIQTFRIKEASVMAPELQARYSETRSYVGESVNDSSNQIRFSITSQGFHGMMFSPQLGTQFVDSYTQDNNAVVVYKKSDLIDYGDRWECHVDEEFNTSQRNALSQTPYQINNANDGVLRDFRLAISTTVEYSSFHWMRAGIQPSAPDLIKKMAVMDAMVVTMTRNNFIYERDLSITMTFVPNNDLLISIGTDNFSNNSAGAILGENQNAIDSIIGFGNYDIGHIFSTGGGGLASLASPCTNRKAQGVTGRGAPVGDPFDVDFVAHEIGHQMGAPHTFNGNAANCAGGNRSANNAYEPASGTTIMAYAGICPPQNIQNNSDAYFHQTSLESIFNNVSSGLSTCAQQIPTGNSAPVANAGPNYTIPTGTPYRLEGSSTDADGIVSHTYTWEQFDLGPSGLPQSNNLDGPLVRSFEGTDNPNRIIPRLPGIVANGGFSAQWEKLPEVARQINYRLTVRDNDSRGGQTSVDQMTIQVDNNAGPFRVTSQSNSGIVWLPNTTETITWDVSGTDSNSVNTSSVNILLSTDAGVTFDTVLASGVPNNGSYDLLVPGGIVATNCRIMVEGAGNIFFAINQSDFNINASVQINCTTYQSGALNIAIPDNDRVGISSIINVPTTDDVDSIKLGVDISHNYIQDMIIRISDPSSNNVALAWNRECANQNDLMATFEDGAGPVLCRQPTVGTFDPSSTFSVFENLPSNGDWTLTISDNADTDAGTLNSWTLEVCVKTITPLSNEDFQLENLSIYPNPNNGTFNILFDNAISDLVQVDVYDLSGRSVFTNEYETSSTFNESINLTGVTAGMYLVKITDGDRVVTDKIIIK
ncbi:T9SS type A sorting domain-containing protein [Nonlabens dokdonensis]|uniref:T9SS type A sorting domain-containing protein n=1 Tax=Nonlabens dokdonensis TaxID=328515 RepID=UPI00130E3796|nr:zinc-dependent metalloprotease family protein [Nonlabens dokdonensis]